MSNEIKDNNKSLFRTLDLKRDLVEKTENDNDYIYTLKFASTTPFERWFGMEIIDVENMDLSRLNNSAPVLFNHDKNKIIGVVEKAWVKDNVGYCDIRLSKTNEEAVKIKQMIDENILSKVSFGYNYLETKFVKEENNLDYYEFKVLAFEVSIVTIPADDTVGIQKEMKRELDILKNNYLNYNNKKDLIKNSKDKTEMENEINATSNEVKATNEVREILELGKLTDNIELSLKFIDEERSLADFKKEIANKKQTQVKQITNNITEETKTNMKDLGEIIKQNLDQQRGFTLRSENYRDYNGFKVQNKGKELHTTTFADVVSNIKHENILKEIGFDVRENVYGDLIVPVLQEAPEGVTQTEEDVCIEGKAFTTTQFRIEKETFTLPIKHSYELLKQSNEYIQQYLIEEGLKAFYTQVGNKLLAKFLKEITLKETGQTTLQYSTLLKLQTKVWTENEAKYLMSKKAFVDAKMIERGVGGGSVLSYDVASKTLDGDAVVVNKIKPTGQNKDYVAYGDFSKYVVALFGYPDIYIDPIPDCKNQFTIKFVGMYGGKLVNPASVAIAEIEE